MYGAELLTVQERSMLEAIDEKLINTLMSKLLKLGKGRLSTRRRWRLQFAIELPTIRMEIEDLIAGRIETWIEKRVDNDEKVA